MIRCTIDETTHLFPYQEEELPSVNLLDWLESQDLYPKFYWQEKGSALARAAVGCLIAFDHPPQIQSDQEVRIYGACAFQSETKQDSTWDHCPRSYFFLPLFELTSDQDQCVLRSYTKDTAKVKQVTRTPHCPSSPCTIAYTPNYSEWKQMCNYCLEAFDKNLLQKVVLARKTSLTFLEPASPFAYVRPNPNITSFLFQMTPEATFIGATPELLFKKRGVFLTTEAIAGTRRRGSSEEEDLRIEKELLAAQKEANEFHLVKQGITELLVPLTTTRAWLKDDQVIKTSSVQHLYNRLEATLLPAVSDHALLEGLHPTAALGGFPKQEALVLLQRLEPFDRGWYGAPIGMISSHGTTFYVGIRSALFRENNVDLFTGVGLVKGSDPLQEWAELNAKLGWFDRSLLQAVHESNFLV